MASILKIGGKWRALARRVGHRAICKTHHTKSAAEARAGGIESQLDAGAPVAEERATAADLIAEYRKLRDASRPIAGTSTEPYTLRTLAADLGELRQGERSL